MTLNLYAQPYDISAVGFYFGTSDEYDKSVKTIKNDFGAPVEEFEIQFIDGEYIDCELAKAIDLNQANFKRFFELVDEWQEHEKILCVIAVGECGYQFKEDTDPNDFEIDIYEENNLRDLALQFVDDGLFGDIPENLQSYIDYDAIARDLAMDYTETVIAGEHLIYRCG